MRDMRVAGIQPSAVTYNCLLKSCVASGSPRDSSDTSESIDDVTVSIESPRDRLRRAERVLREMREDGVATTVVTYNTLIGACVRRAQWQRALEVRLTPRFIALSTFFLYKHNTIIHLAPW